MVGHNTDRLVVLMEQAGWIKQTCSTDRSTPNVFKARLIDIQREEHQNSFLGVLTGDHDLVGGTERSDRFPPKDGRLNFVQFHLSQPSLTVESDVF